MTSGDLMLTAARTRMEDLARDAARPARHPPARRRIARVPQSVSHSPRPVLRTLRALRLVRA